MTTTCVLRFTRWRNSCCVSYDAKPLNTPVQPPLPSLLWVCDPLPISLSRNTQPRPADFHGFCWWGFCFLSQSPSVSAAFIAQVHTNTNLHHLRTRFFSIQLIPAVAHILEQWRKNEMLSHVTNADDDDRYGYDGNADDTISSSSSLPCYERLTRNKRCEPNWRNTWNNMHSPSLPPSPPARPSLSEKKPTRYSSTYHKSKPRKPKFNMNAATFMWSDPHPPSTYNKSPLPPNLCF